MDSNCPCSSCGKPIPSDNTGGRIVPGCNHSYCAVCNSTITQDQQRHFGRPMHDLEVRCKSEGCDSLFFANTELQKLENDGNGGEDVAAQKIVRFAGSDDEVLANVATAPFELALDFTSVSDDENAAADAPTLDADAIKNHPIQRQPRTWTTIEHFMQAAKFDNLAMQEKIRNCAHWHKAHTTAWSLGTEKWLRKNWGQERLAYLGSALKAKFRMPKKGEASSKAFSALMMTADKVTVNCDTDLFWGANRMTAETWQGDNVLGSMLMKCRSYLVQQHEEVEGY